MSKRQATTGVARKALLELLVQVLSDTYVLAVKTHGYHWNVTGPGFGALHAFFDAQYTSLFEAADVIAERIRALGAPVQASMAAFLEKTAIKEASGKTMSASAMLKDLLASHAQLRERLIAAEEAADSLDDLVTQSLLTERLVAHEKVLWMIKSHGI